MSTTANTAVVVSKPNASVVDRDEREAERSPEPAKRDGRVLTKITRSSSGT